MYQSYSLLDVLTYRIIQKADEDVPSEDDHLLVAAHQGLVVGSVQ
jgi:hypothetical protein